MAFLAALPAIIAAGAAIYGQIQRSQDRATQEGASAQELATRRASAQRIADFAPQDQAARMAVWQQTLTAYQPLNGWMGATYGQGAKQNLTAENPFGPRGVKS